MSAPNGWSKWTSEISSAACHTSIWGRFVAHRVGDKNLLRLIQRFLKAGVLEDGAFSASEEGTPQGNLVSPVLSNIYLHHCLDEWFERRFARQCEGKAFLVRYCDDFVVCFEREAEARAFEQALKERLAKFSLEVGTDKEHLIRFGDLAPVLCKRDGLKRPKSFSFLGLTHYLHVAIQRSHGSASQDAGARLRKKLTAMGQRLKAMRTLGAAEMQSMSGRVCRDICTITG